jgi:hypothetical protein
MYGVYRTLRRLGAGVAAYAAMEKEAKKERLEARFTPEQKKHIEHASRIKGTSVSDWPSRSQSRVGR